MQEGTTFEPAVLSTTTDDAIPSYIVVIRTAGERTFDACKALILGQIPVDRLHVVEECPFEEALRCCYRIGIASDAEWMITIDADVLLRSNSIADLLKEARRMPRDRFQLEGLVVDKLTRRIRWAGLRCYRTTLLPEALQVIPAVREEIRPESAVVGKMAEMGFPSARSWHVSGLHDYEQYYSDIYRKAFVHATKHAVWLPGLLRTWQQLAGQDPDYAVAICGAFDGLVSTTAPDIDARRYREDSARALEKLGISEKAELSWNKLEYGAIDAMVTKAASDAELADAKPQAGERIRRLVLNYRKRGVLGFVPFFVGSVFCDIGEQLKKLGRKEAP